MELSREQVNLYLIIFASISAIVVFGLVGFFLSGSGFGNKQYLYYYILSWIFIALITAAYFACYYFINYFYKFLIILFLFVGITILTYSYFKGQFVASYYWGLIGIINFIFATLIVFSFSYFLKTIPNTNNKTTTNKTTLDFFITLANSFNFLQTIINQATFFNFFLFIGFIMLAESLWLINSLVSSTAFIWIIISIISIIFLAYLAIIFWKNRNLYSMTPVEKTILNFFTAIPGITWVIIVFVILLFVLLFSNLIFTSSTSTTSEMTYVFIIIGIVIFISGVAYKLSTTDEKKDENKKDSTAKNIIKAIASSSNIIFYTIFLIICLCLIQKDTLNQYAYIITPFIIMVSIFLFYRALSKNDKKNEKTNIESERIKSIILFLCIIVISILLYSVDPGGLVYTYVGPNFIFTILLGVFGFLYINMLLAYPNQHDKTVYETKYLPGNKVNGVNVYSKHVVKSKVKISNSDSNNLLDKFNMYTVVSSVLFALFLIIVTIIIVTYKGGFFNNRVTSSITLTILLMICILWSVTLVINLFKGNSEYKYKNVFLLLIGFGFLATLIMFLVSFLSNLSGESNIIRLITNIIILLFYFGFFFRTIMPDIFFPKINSSYFGISFSGILIAIVLFMFFGALITYFTNTGFMLQIMFAALIGILIGYFSGLCSFMLELIAILKVILVAAFSVLVAYTMGFISAVSSDTKNIITMIQIAFFGIIGILVGYYSGIISFALAYTAAIKIIFMAFLSILIAYTMGFVNTISTGTINFITILQVIFFAFIGLVVGYYGGFVSLMMTTNYIAIVQMILFALFGVISGYAMGLIGDITKVLALINKLPTAAKIGILCVVFSFIVWLLLKLPSGTLKSSLLAFVPIILFLIYYYLPTLQGMIATQGGNLLIDNPISLNVLTNLSNYEALNGSNASTYKFAISFWVFIDAVPPSTNSSYSSYTSIMNYGEKPNVLYNPSLNSFMITMLIKDYQETHTNSQSELDSSGNLILYVKNDFLLQKWNNVIINYDGGTLDIFLNGELVRSIIEIVPYITLDALTTGADNGLIGNICNFVYYTNALTTTNIYYIYNSMKNENPPAPKKTNNTIVNQIEGGAVIVEADIAKVV